MIVFPKTVDATLTALAEGGAELRAGGTDLQERRQHLLIHGRAAPKTVDLRDLAELEAIESSQRGARIGALASLQSVADHPGLAALWPGLAEACGALANPQIRRLATVGGNLLQKPRCWYYRHPEYACLRKGGPTCFAREGDHLWHVAFDRSPCAAPHPSTVGMALMAYEAEVEVAMAPGEKPVRLPVAEVLEQDALEAQDGSSSALITAVLLGPPLAEERTAYVRASNRALAEWALAEVTVRLRRHKDRLDFVRVAVGGVAPTPLRLTAVEDALIAEAIEPELLAKAAKLAREGAQPLPQTGYKLDLLEAVVLDALEQALEAPPSPSSFIQLSGESTAKEGA